MVLLERLNFYKIFQKTGFYPVFIFLFFIEGEQKYLSECQWRIQNSAKHLIRMKGWNYMEREVFLQVSEIAKRSRKGIIAHDRIYKKLWEIVFQMRHHVFRTESESSGGRKLPKRNRNRK